jgi:aspartyl-tRNA synthetase
VSQFLSEHKRTHNCGELRRAAVGQPVVLMGWVQNHRDHGGCIFVDLRDRYGITQVKFDPAVAQAAHADADRLRSEWVIAVRGVVADRGDNANPNLETGGIEVEATQLEIFNSAETPPFPITDKLDTNENLRLQYRYLDLRRRPLQQNLILRHEVARLTREYLSQQSFLELETPILTKSTPEGARDYLVPSRVHPGEFYALPQSPQIFKQIFMVAGYDRYFQICRCFRDEDLRADRQPEFTQIDIEMSFVGPDDIFALIDGLVTKLWKQLKGVDIGAIPRLDYQQAMNRFGIDRPDMRFGLELVDVGAIVAKSDFKVFTQVVASGGIVKALNAKGGGELSRAEIDKLGDIATRYGAKGMAWVKIRPDGWQGPAAKFFSAEVQSELTAACDLEDGDLLCFVADTYTVANAALAHLRLAVGDKLGLIDKDALSFVWVTDFPLFEEVSEGGAVLLEAPPLHVALACGPAADGHRSRQGAVGGLRPRPQRQRAGRRVDPNPRSGHPAQGVLAARHGARGGRGEVRVLARGAVVRHAAPRRPGAGSGPRGDAADGRRVHPRRHRVPEDAEGDGPDVQRTEPGGQRAAPRAAHRDAIAGERRQLISGVGTSLATPGPV